MKRKTPDSRPWPLIRSASGSLGYDDPLRIRRGAMNPIRPATRTTVIFGERCAKKTSPVESS